MILPPDGKGLPEWYVVHEPTGHRYALKMLATKQVSQTFNWMRKSVMTLYYDYKHASSPEERSSKYNDYIIQERQLKVMAKGFLGECLSLTEAQINALPKEEIWSLFTTIVDYFEKYGHSERKEEQTG